MPINCHSCKVELFDKTNDPKKCNGFWDGGTKNYGPGYYCHNCSIWGPKGRGDNPWYEQKPCIGCKTRLLDGSFQAADKWKAKANEMKAKLAPEREQQERAAAAAAAATAEKKKKENEERAKLAVRIHAGPV